MASIIERLDLGGASNPMRDPIGFTAPAKFLVLWIDLKINSLCQILKDLQLIIFYQPIRLVVNNNEVFNLIWQPVGKK